MLPVEELRQMAKTVGLYHERGFSQSGIAAQLQLSQATIFCFLKQTLNPKSVQISTLSARFHTHLDDKLQKNYNLNEVIFGGYF